MTARTGCFFLWLPHKPAGSAAKANCVRLRFRLPALCVLGALLLFSVLRRSTSPSPVISAQADSAPPASPPPFAPTGPLRRVWALPVDGFRAAALSSGGDYVGVISHYAPGASREQLSLWRWRDKPLAPLWSRPEPNASAITISADGSAVLSCALLDPAARFVSLRQGTDGALVTRQEMDGAVWALQMSPDGQYAAIATGARSLSVLSLGDRPGVHRWPLAGIAGAVSFAPRSEFVAAGTWDESGVSCWTREGKPIWQFPADPQEGRELAGRVFEAQVAQGGQYVLGVASDNVRRRNGTLYLWRSDGDGKPQWTYSLGEDTLGAQALVTADGRFVVATCLRLTQRGDQTVPLRQLLLLDTVQNKVVWKQGNLLFAPTLLALAPDGRQMVISDGVKTLYTLDVTGRITSTYTRLPGLIRQTIASPDGHFLLVYTSDGQLNLMQTG